MLCGFQLRLHRRFDSSMWKDHNYTFLVMKVHDWIHYNGSFKPMSSSLERFLLNKYYADVYFQPQFRRHLHTWLCLATLMKFEEIYQLALAHTTQCYLNDLMGRGSIRSLAETVLIEDLNYDYKLVSLVTRLANRTSVLLQETHSHLLSPTWSTLNSPPHPKATYRFAHNIWHDWYTRNGCHWNGGPTGCTIKKSGQPSGRDQR